MKILVIPDVHGSNKWKDTQQYWTTFDRVIFLGDYADSLDVPPYETYLNVLNILKAADGYDNVDLLIGNHDAHYFMYQSKRGQGYNISVADRYSFLYREYESRLKIASILRTGDITLVFSHAGILAGWVSLVHQTFKETYSIDAFDENDINSIADFINSDIKNSRLSYLLHAIGKARARNGLYAPAAGPLWAHITELKNDPYPGIIQIVGHTPIDRIDDHRIDHQTRCIFSDLGMGEKSFLLLTVNGNEVTWESLDAEDLSHRV